MPGGEIHWEEENTFYQVQQGSWPVINLFVENGNFNSDMNNHNFSFHSSLEFSAIIIQALILHSRKEKCQHTIRFLCIHPFVSS